MTNKPNLVYVFAGQLRFRLCGYAGDGKACTPNNDTFEACTWYRDHWTEDRVIVRTATLK